jgi:alpha-ketoglutarate-dependent taurine dioxygenase
MPRNKRTGGTPQRWIHSDDMNQIQQVIREALSRGWSLLETGAKSSLLELASVLGKPIPSRLNGPLIDMLRVVPPQEARKRSLSSVYGVGAFPWHTDMAHIRVPPRFAVIRSLSQQGVRPTLLLDSRELYQSGCDEAVLKTEVWFVNGGRGRFLTPVLNNTIQTGANIFRYDACVMRPATPSARQSASLMRASENRSPSGTIEWRHGLCVVLDNWRTLHARARQPAETEPERVLERVLVSSEGDCARALGS